MTVQQILEDAYSLGGNLSFLDVYQADGVTFDLTTTGSIRLLQLLNIAQKQIASWKDPSTNFHLRMQNLIASMFFKSYVIDDTVASVSDATFPYNITLANSSGLLGTTDDQYNEWILENTSGTANGQIRMVTDYTGSSYTFYVHDDYDTDPTAADEVKLYKRFAYLLPSTHAFISEHISLPATTDVNRADGNLMEILKIEDVEDQRVLEKAERSEGFSSVILENGDPSKWYRFGNKIYFDLNQRETKWFKMEYYRLPMTLTTASQEPEIPEMFHYALVLWLVEWMYRTQQEATMAYSAKRTLIDFIRATKSQYDVMGYRDNPHGTLRKE